MENWLLSDKDKNIDIDWLTQNIEQLFDTVASLLKSKDEKIINKVCTKLTNLYKDKDLKHQNLIINCIPIFLNTYFNYFYDEKLCSIIEVCILTIYNLSLSDENIKLNQIRVPNLSVPSIYHSPHLSPTHYELTESALGKYETEYVIIEEHFKPYLDTNSLEKKYGMIRFLLLLYYSRLVNIIKSSKLYFCEMCLKMCKINRQTAQVQPIYLNSDIYIEMLHALYYLFNNNLQLDAYIAIEAITLKAEEELLADVILVCNAIKNIIKIEPSMQNALNSYENRNVSIPSHLSFSRKKSLDPLAASSSSKPETPIEDIQSSLNEVYISPTSEIRKEAKRASIKIQEKQKQELQFALESVLDQSPPPVPINPPPPSSSSVNSFNKANNGDSIPSIDELNSDDIISEKL